MTERDIDIEFDFFDEPETQEAASRERSARRVPRRPPRPPSGVAPLLRLLALIAFTIFVVVLLVFWVQSCQGESKQNAYRDYLDGMREVGGDSEQLGRQLMATLATAGIRPPQLRSELNGLVQQQQQGIDRAQGLDPPGPLQDVHADAIEALQFRLSGLRGLRDAFGRTGQLTNAGIAGALLASQSQRLVTSDVVWDDLFKVPAQTTLRNQDVTGVQVPDSNFVSDPSAVDAGSLANVWRRVQGASTGGATRGGLRGNALISVCCDRDGERLSTEEDNVILSRPETKLDVAVQNQGESQEVQVAVRLTIQQSPRPVDKTERIATIEPGETKTVTFSDFPAVDIGRTLVMTVVVRAVQGERRQDNNSARYPVIFSVG